MKDLPVQVQQKFDAARAAKKTHKRWSLAAGACVLAMVLSVSVLHGAVGVFLYVPGIFGFIFSMIKANAAHERYLRLCSETCSAVRDVSVLRSKSRPGTLTFEEARQVHREVFR